MCIPQVLALPFSPYYPKVYLHQRKLDHVYYRWPQSTYRPTIDRYISRLLVGNRPTIGQQLTDSQPLYRPTVSRCISRYVHIYRSTAGRYIGPLSADLSVDYQPIVGQLLTDSWSTVDR